ncbi:MAG: hypothetical protein ACI85I_002465 [Arenicella sp.]|jgi:hypothetical protein
MPNQLINYFRDCYLADQREMTLWSIFDSKIEDLHLLEGEEQLVNGKFPKQYIEDSIAQKWLEVLQVYSKEKQLLYFSLLVTGNSGSELAGRKQICAPLVYYPVEISQDEDNFYYASINFSKRNLNFPLLALLNQSGEDTQSFLEHVLMKGCKTNQPTPELEWVGIDYRFELFRIVKFLMCFPKCFFIQIDRNIIATFVSIISFF